MFAKIKTLFKEKEYTKFFLMFFSGTLLAQIITIGLSPILTRLYTPSEFGVYGVYISIVSILIVFVTGRYEFSINTANEKDAFTLYRIINILSIIIPGILLVTIYLYGDSFISYTNISVKLSTLYFVPLTLMFLGMLQSTTYYLNRKKEFKVLSLSKVIQSLTIGFASIIFSVVKLAELGLVYANILGALVAQGFQKKNIKVKQQTNLTDLVSTMKKYKKYPLYNAPSALFDNIALQAPVFIFFSFFSEVIVGFYTLTIRVIGMPLTLISNSVSQVFLSQVSELHREGKEYYPVIKKTAKYLAVIGLIPLIIILLFAPTLFSLVFGQSWYEAGKYAQILIFGYYFRFIVSPLSVTFFINGEVKILSILQTLRAIVVIVILIIMSKNLTFTHTLLGFTFFEMFFYTIYFILIRKTSLKIEKPK